MAGIALCIPAFSLADSINHAISINGSAMTHEWQYYFGRLDPWMSPATYRIGIVFTGPFITFVLFVIIEKPSVTSCK